MRVLDVEGGVVGHAHLHARRELRLDLGQRRAHLRHHLERVRRGSTQMPMKVAVWPLKRTSAS